LGVGSPGGAATGAGGWDGGGAGGAGGAGGTGGTGGGAGVARAERKLPGKASAAGGGGGSCDTSGTPSMGTDLVSRHGSPRRIPSVSLGRDVRGMIASRDSTSSDDATGRGGGASDVSGDASVTRRRSTPAAARRPGRSSVPG